MNQTYPLYNLSHDEFEKLVVRLCSEILGMGVISFSEGKDKGKDAKFIGRANNFPSESKPWEGKFIIQAKHTTKTSASCSDSEFKGILTKEIKRIENLKNNNELDYYLLFTNRKLSGIQDSHIVERFSKIDMRQEEYQIIGLEKIFDYLNIYPKIVKELGLHKLFIPLNFYEEDIREIIIIFSSASKVYQQSDSELNRVPLEEKNRLNKLSKDYFDGVFKESYNYFDEIRRFLRDSNNGEYTKMYDNTVSDLKAKITTYRNNYAEFEKIIDHLFELILDEQKIKLRENRQMIRIFLHYMYNNCDIGKKE